jgi:multicomponent Na+:H+ antiporter subunit G
MGQILSTLLLVIGAAFSLIAAIGVVRFPDLFLRMHCSTKSATLGVSFIMLGAALHFGNLVSFTKALAAIIFMLVTAPVAAHVLARAAYFAGVPLWKGTLSDEMRGHNDRTTLGSECSDTPGDETGPSPEKLPPPA